MSIVTRTAQWTLSFQDDFDGPAGAEPSRENWARNVGGGGFGNNELQSYTDGNANAFFDGKGNLVIEAREESITGSDGIARGYSSARLLTKGRFSQTYGKFEARIKLARGQGIWPAFWMLAESFDNIGWPECGEIDIIESVGPIAQTVYGTLHGPGYSGGHAAQGSYPVRQSLADGFHVYAVEWEPDEIRWLFDGICYSTVTKQDVAPNAWPFDAPFYMVLNLAVGGDWPGSPDATTIFPQRLVVDYVRVYRAGDGVGV